jgi:diadenosine tetraphosphatase ApaH/serine/threonine PP2A family protein phosphatase
MRAAVISDIHANLHALTAVLADVERERPDAVWCLGDLVGYGPRPNECCRTVRARADLSLVGNHDLVVLGSVDVAEFNPEAGRAAAWTQEVLDDDSRRFLAGLQPHAVADGVELYHGSPRNAVWEYVLDAEAIQAAFSSSEAPVVLIGHSHIPIVARLADGDLNAAHAPEGTEGELEGGRMLLNPGSVGQPRDGDPRAAWLLLDLDEGRASFRRVEYEVERTQEEIREAGLPEALAERLAFGI